MPRNGARSSKNLTSRRFDCSWAKCRHRCLLYPQKRTLELSRAMSALCQKRTHALQQKRSLFGHMVGAGEKSLRHFKAERFGCLKVDCQFVLGWRLNWKVGRLLALEDAIDIAGRMPILVNFIRAIGDEATVCDEDTVGIDGGQSVLRRKCYDQFTIADRRAT